MNSNQKKKLATQKSGGSNSEEVNTNKQISELKKSKTKKKIWTAEGLIESMKPSSEELKFREDKLKANDIVHKGSPLFKCTKCLLNFNNLIKNHKKVPTHPTLGVLMCQKCCDYYEDGEFSLDSDGEDKYCRWCGEGGTIFGCAACICGFCSKCIKRHFKLDYFKKVQKDDNWLCFFCNPKPLWTLRYICSQAIKESEGVIISSPKLSPSRRFEGNHRQNSSPNNLPSDSSSKRKKKPLRKRIYSSSSDESESKVQEFQQKKLKLDCSSPVGSSNERETESLKNIKPKALTELEKVLKLSEYQLSFGANWSKKMLKKLGSSDFLSTSKNLANECEKIKWFLSLLSTYLVQFCNSLNSIEKTLLNEDGTKISSDVPDKIESPYTTILKFLGFINSQIKTFMEKGINLSDILEAEIYDDEKIIGIRKKLNSLNNSFKEKNISSVGNKKNFTTPAETEEKKSEDTECKGTEEQKIDKEDTGCKESTEKQKIYNKDTECNEGTEEKKTDSEEAECNMSTEEYKIDIKNKDSIENSLDLSEDRNSENNSTEYDKENSSGTVIYGMDSKSSDTEEDIQEILAILENA